MEKEVLVSIQGMQFLGLEDEPEGEEPIEIITAGEYYFRNGSHYIRYEEVFEGVEGVTNNLVKIKDGSIEVRKRGVANVHMVFEEDKKNITYYNTPFGQIQMGIATTKIDVEHEEDQIQVKIDYSLDMNETHVADCCLNMNIQTMDRARKTPRQM